MPTRPGPTRLRLRHRLIAATAVLGLALWPACSRGGGGDGGGGGGEQPEPPNIELGHEWGPVPPGPRGPGAVVTGIEPTIEVHNPGSTRTAVVRASVPFAWGQVQDPANFSIENHATAWLVLQRWPDGSVRIAQAQWVETLDRDATVQRRVIATPATIAGAFTPHPVFAGGLPAIGSEVDDAFGVTYDAVLSGTGAVVQETPLMRVRRFRHYHEAPAGTGIGRDYLSATFYVTEFRDLPALLVDYLPGNDYLGTDDPELVTGPNLQALGGVDVDAVRFRARDVDVVLPYRGALEGIGPRVPGLDGFQRFEVMRDTWIADGQMRRYRFLLHRDDPARTRDEQRHDRTSTAALIRNPLRTLADHHSLRQTHALGLLGGPGPAPGDAAVRAASDFESWRSQDHFGTWGSHGDPKLTSQTGTPRNHPLSPELAHAVQSRDLRLLLMLEQKAWIQAARPYHLHGVRVELDDEIFLWDGVPLYPGSRDLSIESLGRRALRANDPYPQYRTRVQSGSNHAHGFGPYDLEHWSMDLVFDYWSVTGDAWAQDELRQLGESLVGVLRPKYFGTAKLRETRSEGWAMQGLVQAFVATGDLHFRDTALDRLWVIVERDRAKDHPSRAIKLKGSDIRTGWPEPHGFYMPWQHGAVLYGYLAGWKFFGNTKYLDVCDDIAECVRYSWVQNVTHQTLGLVPEGLRYYVPTEFDNQPVPPSFFDEQYGPALGSSPLGGAHTFLIGGLLMHSLITSNGDARSLALHHGELLLGGPLGDHQRWNKWFYCVPEQWTGQ